MSTLMSKYYPPQSNDYRSMPLPVVELPDYSRLTDDDLTTAYNRAPLNTPLRAMLAAEIRRRNWGGR